MLSFLFSLLDVMFFKFQLFIFWLLSFLLFHLVVKSTSGEHICALIGCRRYREIGLLSITWNSQHHLQLFLSSPRGHYYELNRVRVASEWMDLSGAMMKNLEKSPFLAALGYVRGQTIKTVYIVWLDSSGWFQKQKHILLLITDKTVFSGNFMYYDAPEDIQVKKQMSPNLAIASYPINLNRLTGFLISSDVFTNSGLIVISQFEVTWTDSKISGLPRMRGGNQRKAFYYLEMGDTPDLIFLVHSTSQPNPVAQLLREVPKSFLNGRDLVLLDMTHGCVHILKDFDNFDIDKFHTSKLTHTFKRINLPFEKYFKCKQNLPIDEKRCAITKYRQHSTVIWTTRVPMITANSESVTNDAPTDSDFPVIPSNPSESTFSPAPSSPSKIPLFIGLAIILGLLGIFAFALNSVNKKNKSKSTNTFKTLSSSTKPTIPFRRGTIYQNKQSRGGRSPTSSSFMSKGTRSSQSNTKASPTKTKKAVGKFKSKNTTS